MTGNFDTAKRERSEESFLVFYTSARLVPASKKIGTPVVDYRFDMNTVKRQLSLFYIVFFFFFWSSAHNTLQGRILLDGPVHTLVLLVFH